MSWTPLSDTTFCDRVNTFLESTRGTLIDPTQLLGDFQMLVTNRLYSDTQGTMQWCIDHPDAQLTRGLKKIVSEINPEWTLNELQKIKDSKILARSKQLLGLQ